MDPIALRSPVSPTYAENRLVHYIPHHAVLRKDSSTTQLRIIEESNEENEAENEACDTNALVVNEEDKERQPFDLNANDFSSLRRLKINDPYTNLVIQDCHCKILHQGTTHMLATLRESYWVPSGRSQVQKVLRKCVLCRKHQGGCFRPPPAPSLPEGRVNRKWLFATTGVDFQRSTGKDVQRPRGQWKLVKIRELHTSRDGNTRSATISTHNERPLRRPLQSLIPLEYNEAEAEVRNNDPQARPSRKAKSNALFQMLHI